MKFLIKKELQEALHDDKVVFFIGSGFSNCFGFPDWKRMVIDVIKELKNDDPKLEKLIGPIEDDIFSPIEILDKLKSYKDTLYNYIKKNFVIDEHKLELLENHRKVWNITNKVITTNYDKALEEAKPGISAVVYDYKYEIAKLNNNSLYLLKLHGSIDNISKCIIYSEDYHKLYDEGNQECAIFQLKKIITENTVVFLGFSLKDPYVREIFKAMNNIYNGYMKKHYIVTTQEEDFSSYNTELIKLDSWNELPSFLDELITYKNNLNDGMKETSIESIRMEPNDTIGQNKIPRVAILIADPIDMNNEININEILQCFSKVEITVDFYYLSIDALRDLENYDYVVLFCQIVRNRFYIENEYLASSPITISELLNNVCSSIKMVYIFTNEHVDLYDFECDLPIVIVKYDKKIKDTVFKMFRRLDKKFIESNCQLIKINQDELKSFKSGQYRITCFTSAISEQIDAKNLKGFIGRVNDLEDIIRKTLQLKISGQVLNIKGAGGLGKTTISKKVAYELSKRGYFEEGIYFIDCEHIDSCKVLEMKISHCFGIDNSINLHEHIRQNNMHKDILIILDNFETLIYLSENIQIKELVKFISDYASIIITSREVVFSDRYLENVHELRSFSTDEAVQLFIQNYPYVQKNELKILRKEILEELLNNNPLAIKIITNNIPKGKDIVSLKNELEKDFFKTINEDYAEIYDRDVDGNIEKSKSLYQSINYSYRRLQEREKLAFELLALFPDGINIENFKNFFLEGSKKLRPSEITDKELKLLENKSLVDINSHKVKLQSIIRRFAISKFQLRSELEKKTFYNEAFEYNKFVLQMCNSFYNKNYQDGYRIFEHFTNNFLETLNYISHLNISNEERYLYLFEIEDYFSGISREKEFIDKISKLKVDENDKVETRLLLTSIILFSEYMKGDFENSFQKMKNEIGLDYIESLDPDNKVHFALATNAMLVFRHEGYLKEYISFMQRFKLNSVIDINITYFQLGQFGKITLDNQEKTFFYFEIKLALNKLNVDELDEYISEINDRDYVEVMQCHYIKSKLGLLTKEQINKLVITNPYTKGIKYLMYAFLEDDSEKKIELYELAISNLHHIKYYYVESIYYYSRFLKDTNNVDLRKWFNIGHDTAKFYNYKYMIHLFECLRDNKNSEYVETIEQDKSNVKYNDTEIIS